MRFLANAYFDGTLTGIFSWGMTHLAAEIAVNPRLFLATTVEVDTAGFDHFGFGVEVSW